MRVISQALVVLLKSLKALLSLVSVVIIPLLVDFLEKKMICSVILEALVEEETSRLVVQFGRVVAQVESEVGTTEGERDLFATKAAVEEQTQAGIGWIQKLEAELGQEQVGLRSGLEVRVELAVSGVQ